MPIRAVVFDVDDTLFQTEAACLDLENEVLARLGRPPMTREIHLRTWGQPLAEAMPQRSPGLDMADFAAVYPTVLRHYVAEGRLDALTPDTLAVLDALRADGRAVMVLTSRTHAELAHLLEPDHPLAGRLHAAYHADNTTHLKPDGRVFDELLDQHELRPAECVYVGDSPTDAHAANAAGVPFIACLAAGVRTADAFADAAVAAYAHALADVPDLVTRLEA